VNTNGNAPRLLLVRQVQNRETYRLHENCSFSWGWGFHTSISGNVYHTIFTKYLFAGAMLVPLQHIFIFVYIFFSARLYTYIYITSALIRMGWGNRPSGGSFTSSVFTFQTTTVQVRVILRLTVSRPVCLGVGHQARTGQASTQHNAEM
jgi:hypothetical protein